MFIALSSTCIQNFRNQLSPFVFLSHSVAVAAWSWIQRVEPQMIFFELFLSPGTQEPLLHFDPPPPEQHFVSSGSRKKYTLSIHPKKDNHPSPYPDQHPCTSLQIWDELIKFGRLSRGVVAIFVASNLLFSWNCSRLGLLTIACESYLVVFSLCI